LAKASARSVREHPVATMSDAAPPAQPVTAEPGLWSGAELWMVSNVAVGVATASFLNLLVPPFITSVTGSASRVGIVFAVLSLAAVVGPIVGRVAGRTGRYRAIYLAALAAMAAAYALLALGAHTWRWTPLFALILGAAYAAQGTLGPAFIVGSNQPEATVAAQLTAFNLAYPIGQLIGALIVAGLQASGVSIEATFWVAAAVMAALTLVTWPTMGQPTRRLLDAQPASPVDDAGPTGTDPKTGRGLRSLLVSMFSTFLAVVVLSSLGNNGLTSQLANVMPAVYGFSASATSLLLGAAGLINIAAIIYAGRRMARRGALDVYRFGTIVRTLGAIAMAVIGLFTTPLLILPAIAMLVTYQGVPIPRVAAPHLAATLAPVPAAEADGYYFAASAIGSVIGCLLAGVLAEKLGYNAVNWMAALAGIGAVALLVLSTRARQESPT
jgi:predicted MFS family arabinose efflux permease